MIAEVKPDLSLPIPTPMSCLSIAVLLDSALIRHSGDNGSIGFWGSLGIFTKSSRHC